MVFVRKGEGDVEHRRLLVLIFNFRFSERALAVEAPVDGLEASVDVALFHDEAQRTDFSGFRVVAHGAVRIVPEAENAEALEVGELELRLLHCIGAGERLHLVDGEVLPVLLFNLHFDRHAVAVPARDVGRAEAFEGLLLDDHVLQDLVDRVTEVNCAVGIGRAVVKNELLRVAACVENALDNLLFIPFANPARFALGEVPSHREGCIRQVERILLIVSLCHFGQNSWPPRALQVERCGRPGCGTRRFSAFSWFQGKIPVLLLPPEASVSGEIRWGLFS